MHDGCAEAMLQIWREANAHFIHEPRTIFASLVPPRELLRDQPRAIVPDAAVDLALSATSSQKFAGNPTRQPPSSNFLNRTEV